MPSWSRSLFVVLLIAVVAACGKQAPPAAAPREAAAPAPPALPPDDTDADIAALGGFADRACACKDRVCLEHLKAELEARGAAARPKEDAPSTTQTDQLIAVSTRYQVCADSVLAASGEASEGAAAIAEAVDRMGTYAELICICPSMACAERVKQVMDAYGDTLFSRIKGAKPTERQMEQLMARAKQMDTCAQKLSAAAP